MVAVRARGYELPWFTMIIFYGRPYAFLYCIYTFVQSLAMTSIEVAKKCFALWATLNNFTSKAFAKVMNIFMLILCVPGLAMTVVLTRHLLRYPSGDIKDMGEKKVENVSV